MTPVLDGIPARDQLLVVRVDGRRVTIGPHAIERYLQRVKPALGDPRAAAADLERVIAASASVRPAAPEWKARVHRPDTERARPAVAWLWLGDDVALPLARCLYEPGAHFVPTTLCKGSCSEARRVARASFRRAAARADRDRRRARRAARTVHRGSGHRARRLRYAPRSPDLEQAA